MRARFSLAEELELEEQFDEAIKHYRELIRPNPGDNQGVRRPLARLLAELNRDTELRGVIDEFKEDESPEWLYTDALVAFRLAQPDANDRLARALKGNRHVPPFLMGAREIPDVADAYRIGSVEEAALAVDWLLDAWSEPPGALRWRNTQRRVLRMWVPSIPETHRDLTSSGREVRPVTVEGRQGQRFGPRASSQSRDPGQAATE